MNDNTNGKPDREHLTMEFGPGVRDMLTCVKNMAGILDTDYPHRDAADIEAFCRGMALYEYLLELRVQNHTFFAMRSDGAMAQFEIR